MATGSAKVRVDSWTAKAENYEVLYRVVYLVTVRPASTSELDRAAARREYEKLVAESADRTSWDKATTVNVRLFDLPD